MMRGGLTTGLIGAALAVMASQPVDAQSHRVRAENRVFAYDAQLPACDAAGPLSTIQSRFASREAAHWNSNLTVTSIDHVRETGFRPNGADLIPRRYCEARAILSDGSKRRLSYNLVEDAGITGWHGSLFLGLVRFPTPGSYNVEWCVSGLDRSWNYSPDCRMARP